MLGGNPGSASNPSDPSTHLLYSGEHFDTSLQMYYNRARWYNPLNGRFNRMDDYAGSSQDPQSLHKYLYCHANPINNLDPTGTMSLAMGITIAGAISTIIGGIMIGVGIKVKNDVVRDLGIAFVIMGLSLIGGAALLGVTGSAVTGAEVIATALAIFRFTFAITIMGGLITDKVNRLITKVDFKRFLEFYAADDSRKIPAKGILIFREGHGDITKVEIPNFVFSVKPPYMTNDTVYAYECTNPDSATNFVIKKYKIDSDGKLNEEYTMERSMQGLAEVDKRLPIGWTIIK